MHAGRIVRSGHADRDRGGAPVDDQLRERPRRARRPRRRPPRRPRARAHDAGDRRAPALAVRPAGLGRAQRGRARRPRRSQPEPRDRVPLDRRRRDSAADPDRPRKEPSDDHALADRFSLAPHREPDALERGPALAQPPRVRLRRGAAAAAARCCCSPASAAPRPSGAGAIVTMFLVIALFPVYYNVLAQFVSRRDELVLKRMRTGETRDAELLASIALPGAMSALVLSAVAVPIAAARRPAAARQPGALRGAGGAGGHHVHRVRLLDRGVDPERRGRTADQHADHHPGLPRPADQHDPRACRTGCARSSRSRRAPRCRTWCGSAGSASTALTPQEATLTFAETWGQAAEPLARDGGLDVRRRRARPALDAVGAARLTDVAADRHSRAWRRWSDLTGVERVGLYTRQSLYLVLWAFNGSVLLAAARGPRRRAQTVALLAGGARRDGARLRDPVRCCGASRRCARCPGVASRRCWWCRGVYVAIAATSWPEAARDAAVMVVVGERDAAARAAARPPDRPRPRRGLGRALRRHRRGGWSASPAGLIFAGAFLFTGRASMWLLGIVTELDDGPAGAGPAGGGRGAPAVLARRARRPRPAALHDRGPGRAGRHPGRARRRACRRPDAGGARRGARGAARGARAGPRLPVHRLRPASWRVPARCSARPASRCGWTSRPCRAPGTRPPAGSCARASPTCCGTPTPASWRSRTPTGSSGSTTTALTARRRGRRLRPARAARAPRAAGRLADRAAGRRRPLDRRRTASRQRSAQRHQPGEPSTDEHADPHPARRRRAPHPHRAGADARPRGRPQRRRRGRARRAAVTLGGQPRRRRGRARPADAQARRDRRGRAARASSFPAAAASSSRATDGRGTSSGRSPPACAASCRRRRPR